MSRTSQVAELAGIEAEARAPFRYVGSKNHVARLLLRLLPDATGSVFCEPFCGSAAVSIAFMRRNRQAFDHWVLNDLDELVIHCFREIQQNGENFAWQCLSTPYSSEALAIAGFILDSYWNRGLRSSRLAWAFVVRRSMSFASNAGFSRPGKTAHKKALKYAERCAGIEPLSRLLAGVEIRCQDAVECIKEFDCPDALFFIDPPYHPDARMCQELYDEEMSAEKHAELLDACCSARGRFVITGYANPMYNRALRGWKSIKKRVRSGGLPNSRSRSREEMVWLRL